MNRHAKTALAAMVAGMFAASSAVAYSGTGSTAGGTTPDSGQTATTPSGGSQPSATGLTTPPEAGTTSSAGTGAAGQATSGTSPTSPSGTQQRSAQGGQPQRAQAPKSAAPAGVPAVLVLMPTQQASDPSMANGCWVRFYDHENYKGESLTLVGPVDMPNMEPPGAFWNEWDSAIVGPKARVTTYDDENYRDERTATLSPGDQIHDLGDEKLGWFEEIKSAKVACTP